MRLSTFLVLLLAFAVASTKANSGGAWIGILRDEAGMPVADASIKLHAISGSVEYVVKSATGGKFSLSEVTAGTYELSIEKGQKIWNLTDRGSRELSRSAKSIVQCVGRITRAEKFPDGSMR